MAPKKDYTPKQMGDAIEAVRGGEPVAAAAKRFGEHSKVLEDPSGVLNTDESAFFLSQKPGQVLVKGEKYVYAASGDKKENLTVLVTANAAGKLAPLMIVFAYERIPANIANSVTED